MLKQVNETPMSTAVPRLQPVSITTLLKKHPQVKKLLSVLGVDPSEVKPDIVDNTYVIEGRFDQTADRSAKIYLDYKYDQNRRINDASMICIQQDMKEHNWSSIADTGLCFTMEDGVLTLTDAHHRVLAASHTPEFDTNPLRTRFVIALAALEEVYVKTDRGTPRTLKHLNKAAKFHTRLGLTIKACDRLHDVAVAATCNGMSKTSTNEKVMFQRDETRFEIMKTYRDTFVRLEELCRSAGAMKDLEDNSGYGGMFNAKLRWEVLDHRSFRSAIVRLITDHPEMAEDIFGFAAKLIDFDGPECQNLAMLSKFFTHPLNRTKGGIAYETAYDATLVCLRDYLNGDRTDEENLYRLIFRTQKKRDLESTTWPSNSTQTFENAEFELNIGDYKKTIRAYKISKRKRSS